VALLCDLARNGLPWAAVVEFQFAPDAGMFGRLLVYLGQVWLELRPSDLPGDRFCVTAVVVNLTGRGNSGRQLEWPEAGVATTLKPRELDLSELRAQEVLDGVEAGRIPRVVLAWLPVMQNGAENGMIQRCLKLTGEEPGADRRADLGLALVFAELAGCREVWNMALDGWNMVESQVVKQWQDDAMAAMLLRQLQVRYGELPVDRAEHVRQPRPTEELDRWIVAFATATTLEQFRLDTRL